MLKDKLASFIGRNNYVNHIMFITKLYHSFRTFRHPAIPVIRKHLIPCGGTVLDIGANIGKFTATAAAAVGRSGRVYSFEPVPFVLRVLRAMVRLRFFSQVTVISAALADKNGFANICIPLKDGWKPLVPIAHLGGDGEKSTLNLTIETRRLDDFCDAEKIRHIDFIKCDTEGAEYSVFSGALKTLARDLPAVMCEIYHDYLERQKAKPSDVFGIFKTLGWNS